MTDPERYLAKARESLASCEADVAAGRCNSAANRAYYAAFQAAVAALLHEGIRPETENWQHRFVLSQFSGKLERRLKRVPAELSVILDVLFRTRIRGDYEPDGVSARQATRATHGAARFVEEIEAMMLNSFKEASAEYDAAHRHGQTKIPDAERFVSELQSSISAAVPSADYSLSRLGPSEYRMYCYVDSEDEEDRVHDALGARTIDILTDHDIWIVILPRVRGGARH